MTAEVFTDGSCVNSVDKTRADPGGRGFGGWCAVVENGHDGWVRRGSALATTAVRMELVAVINGLRSLPDRTAVRLWFDCTVILSIADRMDRPAPWDWTRSRDGDLWAEVADELVRLDVELRLIEKREKVPQHQRAHTFAGGEAKKLREETRRRLAA